MMEIKKNLKGDSGTATATVAAMLDFGRRRKIVEVRLAGTVLGGHTPALRDFLKNLSYFPGNKWVMHLENLQTISLRGLRALVTFARVIRRRGYIVEITGIQAAVHITMRDLNLCKDFAWDMINDQSMNAEVAPPRSSFNVRSAQFAFAAETRV